MEKVVIINALRTPIGRFNGALSTLPAASLGAVIIKELVERAGLKSTDINEVIMGQVLQAGCGQNPARQASLEAGLSESTPSMTINKVCGSGLKAIQLGAQAIQCGDAEIVIAGGQENMSLAPHLQQIRRGKALGNISAEDSIVKDGLWCAINNHHMGVTAENIAEKFNINREQQDTFAHHSQQKTKQALDNGFFDDEIVPLSISNRKKQTTTIDTDEHPRPDTTLEDLAKLSAAFKADGSVTPGNASGINDGAAAVLLMSESKAKELGLKPTATFAAAASVGIDPSIMGMGPVGATIKCLEKANWQLDEVDLFEANEAFAAQMLGVSQELGLDPSKVNVGGGAIALGHPIGASGARILVTLIHHMNRQKAKKGIATLCIGGGLGIALAVESAN